MQTDPLSGLEYSSVERMSTGTATTRNLAEEKTNKKISSPTTAKATIFHDFELP